MKVIWPTIRTLVMLHNTQYYLKILKSHNSCSKIYIPYITHFYEHHNNFSPLPNTPHYKATFRWKELLLQITILGVQNTINYEKLYSGDLFLVNAIYGIIISEMNSIWYKFNFTLQILRFPFSLHWSVTVIIG